MDLPMTGAFRSDGQPLSLKEYEAVGGYQGLRKALHDLTPDDVIGLVTDAKLSGKKFYQGFGIIDPRKLAKHIKETSRVNGNH